MDNVYFIEKGRQLDLLPKESILLAIIKNKIADLFKINCHYNSRFISGYLSASEHLGDINVLIFYLEDNMPKHNPFRERAIMQLNGFKEYQIINLQKKLS